MFLIYNPKTEMTGIPWIFITFDLCSVPNEGSYLKAALAATQVLKSSL
jgi:hypothetical protein